MDKFEAIARLKGIESDLTELISFTLAHEITKYSAHHVSTESLGTIFKDFYYQKRIELLKGYDSE